MRSRLQSRFSALYQVYRDRLGLRQEKVKREEVAYHDIFQIHTTWYGEVLNFETNAAFEEERYCIHFSLRAIPVPSYKTAREVHTRAQIYTRVVFLNDLYIFKSDCDFCSV